MYYAAYIFCSHALAIYIVSIEGQALRMLRDKLMRGPITYKGL